MVIWQVGVMLIIETILYMGNMNMGKCVRDYGKVKIANLSRLPVVHLPVDGINRSC